MDYQYTLEKYKTIANRYTCPSCGKARQFTRYVHTETGEHLADYVGRCNRESECGYHYKPKQFFQDNPNAESKFVTINRQPITHNQQTSTTSIIPMEIVEKSLVKDKILLPQNNFLEFLKNRFGITTVTQTLKRFYIGTSKHWQGATIFWQVDASGHTRTGKVMLYDRESGKRVKLQYNHITWAHTLLIKNRLIHEPFTLDLCLFGEHQIKKSKVSEVAILESEKTAVIASIYLPQYTWMACGGLSMLNTKRLEAIKKYPIILYPDLKALDKWKAKAEDLKLNGFRVTVSDLLEKFASEQERANGLDLADYLLKLDPPKTKLQKMIEKNANLQTLIERFDLVEVDQSS